MRTQKQTYTGTGILTRCPSPTLTRLGLGPTNPGTITVARETSLFRWGRFSLPLWLLIPAFSLDNAPPHLSVWLRCDINAPLPLRYETNHRFFSSLALLAALFQKADKISRNKFSKF